MKVIITGARGRIGSVLMADLDALATSFDLPDDVRAEDQLKRATRGHSAIIHLAWDTEAGDECEPSDENPNILMVNNVLHIAGELGLERVVLASSVHVHDLLSLDLGRTLSDRDFSAAETNYARGKRRIEAIANESASKSLQIICIRFGGVFAENRPDTSNPLERAIFLSHRDCTSMVLTCLTVPLPAPCVVLTAVSANEERIHPFENGLRWMPTQGLSAQGELMERSPWIRE